MLLVPAQLGLLDIANIFRIEKRGSDFDFDVTIELDVSAFAGCIRTVMDGRSRLEAIRERADNLIDVSWGMLKSNDHVKP